MSPISLIIDSGATKSAWAWTQDGVIIHTAAFPGIHPFFLDDAGLEEAFRKGSVGQPVSPAAIFYYGTGCKPASSQTRIRSAVRKAYPAAGIIEVNTDLLGAARALCRRSAGIACILGTGSNSAYYDGEQIVRTAGGLGFILGDEGSGADLGKTWVSAWMYDEVPDELGQKFADRFGLAQSEVIEAVYRKAFPSRYLAQFAVFLRENIDHPYINRLVGDRFTLFFKRHLPLLAGSGVYPVHFTGSIAVHFSEILEKTLSAYGFFSGLFFGDPIKGLAVF
ncbi:MAG TPA: hypothetical protein PKB07_23695, partial [Flavilitoribacter sp.]|nr:hypothetical protein [Flavilitoribacter sp.]